jgi:hypothetical protein
VTGPYEHAIESQVTRVCRGRIELAGEDYRTVATVLSGEATFELIEQFDDAITAFGLAEPIRFVGRRQLLRLTVECDLDAMTITREPGTQFGGGDGEAVTSPDSRHRF